MKTKKRFMKQFANKTKNIQQVFSHLKWTLFPVCCSMVFLTFRASLQAQSSYQLKLDNPGYYFEDVSVNEMGKPILMLLDTADSNYATHFYLTNISGQTGAVDAWKVDIDGGAALYHAIQTSFQGKMACFSHSKDEASFSCLDVEMGTGWAKKINNQNYEGAFFCQDPAGNTVLANSPQTAGYAGSPYSHFSVVELYKLDANGNTIWKRGFEIRRDAPVVNAKINLTGIAQDKTGNIYIMGSLRGYSEWLLGGLYEFFLVKLDPTGIPLIWKRIDGHYWGKILASDDGIFLLDKGFFEHVTHTFDIGEPNAANLLKLDHDLNLVWAKRYSADHFWPYFTAAVLPRSDGKLLMSHSMQGDFPAILTELDANGDILSQKGYSNYSPRMHVLDDGSLILSSQFFYPGMIGSPQYPVIAKSDTKGNIADCPSFQTCMKAEDIAVEFGNISIDTLTALDLQPLPINVEPIAFSFSDFCGFPPLPVPTFAFPDTLCVTGSGITMSDDNRLAQGREWHLTGPAIDSVLVDSFEFAYQFNIPGNYLLQQTIWVLGCPYNYERQVTVLPPLALVIADTLLCPDQPLEVSVAGSRTATYIWRLPNQPSTQSGATVPFIGSGNYAVTATDGYCEATDSANIGLVTSLIGTNTPLVLPADTISCMPYELVPFSLFADEFFMEHDSTGATSFTLTAPGAYRIGMEAFGCKFWQVYNYGVDCHVNLYLPNSFSPNGDGINDVFQAFGPSVEVLQMSIYDRWGGLIHQGLTWDGGKAGQGVYTYKLHYLNLRSGEKEELLGEVVLIK